MAFTHCYALVISVLFLVLFAFSTGKKNYTTVKEVISERERIVKEIAQRAEQIYNNRENELSCDCSLHDCGNDFNNSDERECTSELIFETCEAQCKQRWVDYKSTGVRTPDGVNPEVLDVLMKQFICLTSHLNQDFTKVREEHGLGTSWTYIGLRNGGFRTWPLRARGRIETDEQTFPKDCKTYDPRRRPWYSAAATGPKDAIILVDRSASTGTTAGSVGEGGTLWLTLQIAVEQIVDTWTHIDYVNIVLFSSTAEALWNESSLVAATAEVNEELKDRTRRETPSGSTNIHRGFHKAFKLLTKGFKEGNTSKCNKIIIFLTEGRDTELKTSQVLKRIESMQKNLKRKTGARAHIFTYSFGLDADESLARQISCEHQGLWNSVTNFVNPLSDMTNYLETMAVSRSSKGPVWIQPYEDAGGLGVLTTVSVPVFSSIGKNGKLPILWGVVGHDVMLSDLTVGKDGNKTVLNHLVHRSKQCQLLNFTKSDIQASRFASNPLLECADVYHKATCYKYQKWYYRRYAEKDNQANAQVFCEKRRGNLSPIRSDQHLRFLSAIASQDRTWIGGHRKVGSEPIKFTFKGPNTNSINQYHPGWAVKHPGELRQKCISIDRRGTMGNLESRLCDNVFDFICELPDDSDCGNNVLEVTDDEDKLMDFKVPAGTSSSEYERVVNDIQPIDKAYELLSEQVICPFGPPVYHEELYCCCSNNTSTNSASNASSNFLPISLKLIWFVYWGTIFWVYC